MPNFKDRGCRVVSATDPHGSILGFLDQSSYNFFQVAPQLYSRGWVDPVPDPLLLRKSGSAENRALTSGSVARNSWLLDHRGGRKAWGLTDKLSFVAVPLSAYLARREYWQTGSPLSVSTPLTQENWFGWGLYSVVQQSRSKAIPVTDRGGLQGCEMLRISHCIDNRLTDGGKVVNPTHRPRSTPQKHYFSTSGTHFCYARA
jgi:hypothetical protein